MNARFTSEAFTTADIAWTGRGSGDAGASGVGARWLGVTTKGPGVAARRPEVAARGPEVTARPEVAARGQRVATRGPPGVTTRGLEVAARGVGIAGGLGVTGAIVGAIGSCGVLLGVGSCAVTFKFVNGGSGGPVSWEPGP